MSPLQPYSHLHSFQPQWLGGAVRGQAACAGRLAAEIGKVIESAITHPQGSYAVEKMLDHGDPPDILEMTEPVWNKPYNYARHKHALHKYIKLVDKLVSGRPHPPPFSSRERRRRRSAGVQRVYAFTSAEHKEECSGALDAICKAFLADDQSFDRLLHLDLGGRMLLNAAQGGLPNHNAVRVSLLRHLTTAG